MKGETSTLSIQANSSYALSTTEQQHIHHLLPSLIQLIRVKQWIKNGFVFVPLLFVFGFPSFLQLYNCAIGAFLFCLVSSAVYIMNDIVDVQKDRAHPVKKNRPIASGAVPIPLAYAMIGVLLISSLLGAFYFNKTVALLILSYFVINIAYSLFLKKLMFIDVFTISLGFILRICAGFMILNKNIAEPVNTWFILFVAFLTLFIGVGKRCSELKTLGNNSSDFRESLRGCSIAQLEQIIVMLMTCTIMSYAIFVYASKIILLYATSPVLLYGIFRYHFLNNKSDLTGSPEMIVYKDRPILVSMLVWAFLFALICVAQSFTA
ncbi:MAG: UbiA prenyltransferase family protein [Lachnospiraceae bacterium]|nr:UbiA prenyltransferase family protein [Lachnospiraceae bacterium]